MTFNTFPADLKKQVTEFTKIWGVFLLHLGNSYLGKDTPNLIDRTKKDVLPAIEDAIFDTMRIQCRGGLEQNVMIGLVGRICGDQFARHVLATGATYDNVFPVEAAKMFQIGFRVAAEQVMMAGSAPTSKIIKA